MNFGIGDLVKFQGRKYRVGRVWADGDLRLELDEEPGRDAGVVFGENVTLLVKAPEGWLQRLDYPLRWWGDLGRRVQVHDDWKTEAPVFDRIPNLGLNARN